MKKNPYQEAAEIEIAIKQMQKKLSEKEGELNKIIAQLKSSNHESKKSAGLRDSLAQREKDIYRMRGKLKGKIKQKRKKENEGKKLQFGGVKKVKQRAAASRDLTRELKNQENILSEIKSLSVGFTGHTESKEKKESDLFISHASEDKNSFVRPLADELINLGVSVWYDEYSLTIGDSLRESIDKGLSQSRFGLIVLSQNFFDKNWTKYELNGLVAKEMEGEKVILPIWHHITKDEVMRFSPTMVDKVALNSALLSVSEIAKKVADAVKRA